MMSNNPTSADNCPNEQAISAFHDGELLPADRAEMARHIAWCEACAYQLSQLRQMSGLLTSISPDGLSQIAWHRLHAKLDEVLERGLERGLVRWAWEVSAIAAAILVVASVCLTRLSDRQNTTESVATATVPVVPPWVGAQAATDPTQVEAPSPAGMWYLADARNSNEVSP